MTVVGSHPLNAAASAHPIVWLGAKAPGGLALPSATPSADHLYAPRGVWLDDERLVVADTGNHRILIWHGVPRTSHSPADVVLGQVDFTHEGAQGGGRGPERGLRLPTGVIVHEGRLIVADAWNHRVLIWDSVPERSDVAPDVVIGQPDASCVEANRDGACSSLGFYWPFGVAVIGGRFYVADTGNRRVLSWDAVPDPDVAPDVVIGQPDATSRDENRGALGPDSFRWPHDLAGDESVLLVTDAGNHRVLGWCPPPRADGPASMVLGQSDFHSGAELPYAPQSADGLRFPYAIDTEGSRLAVADTANNRILIWEEMPDRSATPADGVLGQPDFAANGENRWERVADDTLCWPYGISLHRECLAVADSGNNRVVIWSLR
ncbi:MAG: NHL repeat-containing protein [Actinomycetota bacterium]|nr:NHL repeat-containing protein [Actinomycetota bacterium]